MTTFIKVEEKTSKRVLEILFKRGFTWQDGTTDLKDLDCDYICIEGKKISYLRDGDDFSSSNYVNNHADLDDVIGAREFLIVMRIV